MATRTDGGDHCELPNDDEPSLVHARKVISSLLAIAYRRSLALQRVQDDPATSGNHELANAPGSSVHGDVL